MMLALSNREHPSLTKLYNKIVTQRVKSRFNAGKNRAKNKLESIRTLQAAGYRMSAALISSIRFDKFLFFKLNHTL